MRCEMEKAEEEKETLTVKMMKREYVDVFSEDGKLLASFYANITRRQYKLIVDAMQWVIEQGPYVL